MDTPAPKFSPAAKDKILSELAAVLKVQPSRDFSVAPDAPPDPKLPAQEPNLLHPSNPLAPWPAPRQRTPGSWRSFLRRVMLPRARA